MKTPEEVAREIREKSASQAYRHHPKWLMSESLIAAAIAAERQRADALAEALREIEGAIKEMMWADGLDTNVERIETAARAALAAYDAEAK